MIDADLVRLCAEAYLPVPSVEAGADLAANVVEVADTAVVAFRGTSNVAGWHRDFDALPKSHPLLGFCHRGFLSGGAALWQRLDLPLDKPVVLTGHSLGGALALIVGGLRLAAGERVDQVVTFGSPRAGYQQFVDLFKDTIVRQYVRGNDPVPGVPLDMPAFPYKHVREPLVRIGTPSREPWTCHSVLGYQKDIGA